MKTAYLAGVAICSAVAAAISLPATADGFSWSAHSPVPGERSRPAGEGVLCLMAISSLIAEVGRRCYPGREVALQAELERSVARLENFVLRNSETTQEELMLFRQRQGLVGAPEAVLCEGDPAEMYRHAASRGADEVREWTDRLVSRPGTPTWGDCL